MEIQSATEQWLLVHITQSKELKLTVTFNLAIKPTENGLSFEFPKMLKRASFSAKNF